jgi:predicted RND superfamily exporter protein
MKPVYQTVVDKGLGNCMQAAIASMFELELDDVPNFVLWADNLEWYHKYTNFMQAKGFDVETISCNTNFVTKETIYEDLKRAKCINEAIYCSVKSSIFEGGSHAVLINNRGIVIHDPNPNKFFLGMDVIESGHLISFENLLDIDYSVVHSL